MMVYVLYHEKWTFLVFQHHTVLTLLDQITLNENEIVSCSEQAIWSFESWEFDFNTMLCWKRTHSVWCYYLPYECLQFVELVQCRTTVCRMSKCLMGHLKLQIVITAKLLTLDGPLLWAPNLQSFDGCWLLHCRKCLRSLFRYSRYSSLVFQSSSCRCNEIQKQCFWTTDIWWIYWCLPKEYPQAKSNY